jgi:hypothetical protein
LAGSPSPKTRQSFMKTDYYTYAYLREDGTPYYIGKGRGRRAFSKHRKNLPVPPRDRILFLKTGLTEEEANKHEVYLVFVLGRKDKGTGILWNFTDGGEGVSGRIVSNETRKKISDGHAGKPLSEEHRKKLSEAHTGKKLSPEHIEKLRGKAIPIETRERISQTLQGRKRPSEVIEKIRQGNLGRIVSEETREKLRKSHLGRKPSEETREKLRQAGLRRWERKRMEGG